ncbi:MAG: 50S ribosomal protein L3 [Candidatus Bathyarchaeia archaeon]
MGHRKKHAPHRGSLAFRPRGRAASLIATPRYWPQTAEPKLLGFAGYKAGMSHAFILEDNPTSPNYGREIFTPVTIVETPPLTIIALRAYETTTNGLKTLGEAWAKTLPKHLTRTLKPPPNPNPEEDLKTLEAKLDQTATIRAIAATNPHKAGLHKKKPEVFEVAIGGNTPKDQLEYGKTILGKEIDVTSFVKEGQCIDVAAVTKGKGFQGPVKRFGVRILQDKSRKHVRSVGCIGPWHPASVTYTVARAGQMGYARRVELNKRVLKIGTTPAEANPREGFNRYGILKGHYLLLKGSIPGTPKRLIILRQPARPHAQPKPPTITLFPPEVAAR